MKKYLSAATICATLLISSDNATASSVSEFTPESEEALLIIGYDDSYNYVTNQYKFRGIDLNELQLQKNSFVISGKRPTSWIKKPFGVSNGIRFVAKVVPPGEYVLTHMYQQPTSHKRVTGCSKFGARYISLRPGQVGLFSVPNRVLRGDDYKGAVSDVRLKAAFDALENDKTAITVNAELFPARFIQYQKKPGSSNKCVKKNQAFTVNN